jgi:hypothetical protein
MAITPEIDVKITPIKWIKGRRNGQIHTLE